MNQSTLTVHDMRNVVHSDQVNDNEISGYGLPRNIQMQYESVARMED